MFHWRWRVQGALAIILAIILAGCSERIQGGDSVRVAVSIPPLADMARQIGGDRVSVVTLVPPGASVHTYEPTPRQVQFISTAHLLILNGVNLEFWAPKVIDAANNPRLRVIYTAQGLTLLEQASEEGGNPHVWLDPINAIYQAKRISDALVEVDPEHQGVYRENAARYIAELQALDEEIRRETATWTHRRFVAFHSAWVYFAQRYGLEQVAAIEEFPGKEPSPEYLARVVDMVRELNVPVVFAEPQLPLRAAEAVAAEAKVKVITLDPLGGTAGRETYIDLMRYNLAQMAKGLQ